MMQVGGRKCGCGPFGCGNADTWEALGGWVDKYGECESSRFSDICPDLAGGSKAPAEMTVVLL